MSDQTVVDNMRPSRDWQTLACPVVVLPIGSCEQHGAHMPLATDALEATYFARVVARELGAALLPTLPLFQSYEHAGFRGSFSLRPETAMAVIRDLAGEVERQNFTRLVIINGHGGNFALPTVVRDINRLDGAPKIVLLNFWEFDTSPEGRAMARGEIHSAGWETSVMLALHEELVGDLSAAASPAAMSGSFRQSDLNLFGFGAVRPNGVWGVPANADAEVGRRIVASIETNLVAAVRERLQWLDKDARYGGAGPVALRAMTEDDLGRGVELCRAVGWNQQLEDWRLFHACSAGGCFVAVHNGRVAGTVTTIDYGGVSRWVGMVLVDPRLRRRGIGTRLLERALGALEGCGCVKLDATPTGRDLYLTLGFRDEYRLCRMTCAHVAPPAGGGDAVRAMHDDDLPAVGELDAAVFGAPRLPVLRRLFAIAPEYAHLAIGDDGRPTGFILGRHGAEFEQLGPVTAADLPTAQALLGAALTAARGRAVLTDANLADECWPMWLRTLGFTRQRPFIRMFRGVNVAGVPTRQYSIAGPELG